MSCSYSYTLVAFCIVGTIFLVRVRNIFTQICNNAVLRIRIRDPVPFWPLDPGSGVGKKLGSASGIRIRDEQPGSYFRELKKLGSGMQKFGSEIRDEHPGPATL
jgi:hypothetical protein